MSYRCMTNDIHVAAHMPLLLTFLLRCPHDETMRRANKRQNQRRGPITFGEVREALRAHRDPSPRIKMSARMRRALAKAQTLEKSLSEFFSRVHDSIDSTSDGDEMMQRLWSALDVNPNKDWGELTVAGVRELIGDMKPKRGRPIDTGTQERIRRAAELKLSGLSQYKQAPLLFPQKTKQAAYDSTRAFYFRNRTSIDVEMIRQQQQAPQSASPAA